MTTQTLESLESVDGDVMDLLRRGIPLTLLLDLADPFGPRSDELYDAEGSAA